MESKGGSFYDNFVGKKVVITANEERICGKLCSIDGYLNVALESPTESVYVKGSAVDYIALIDEKEEKEKQNEE